MSRASFAIFIGVLSSIAHVVLAIMAIWGLNQIHLIPSVSDQNKAKVVVSTVLVFCLVMAVVSAFMARGVIKKRPELMAPWMISSIIGIASSIMDLITTGANQPPKKIIAGIFYISIACLIWYPIYTLWRDMRSGKYPVQLNNHQLSFRYRSSQNSVNATSQNLYSPPPQKRETV